MQPKLLSNDELTLSAKKEADEADASDKAEREEREWDEQCHRLNEESNQQFFDDHHRH
jgi:hypothetical protein